VTTKGRRPLVAGNWKLYKTLAESRALASEIREQLGTEAELTNGPEVALGPVFTALTTVRDAISGSTLRLAAQDSYWEPQGAFTGQVSAALLADVGCHYVIAGHSERRQLFHESDADVNKKARAVLKHGMAPIVCVGETLTEREAGSAEAVVVRQLSAALADISEPEMARVVIAYEPVWAIGTGKNAQPKDAQEMHATIRAQLSQRFGAKVAAGCRVLYGGSVKPENAAALMAEPDIDGALVGGASLAAASFCAIVRAASSVPPKS
jgi:triosephosphate isomerase